MRKSDDVHIKSIKVNGKRYWSNWRSTFISDNKRQAKEAAYKWAEMKRKQGKKAFVRKIEDGSGYRVYRKLKV